MVKSFIFFTFCLVSRFHGQVNELASKFFFDLPFNSSKFEIRAKINGNNNFYGFTESSALFTAFSFHPFIKNLPNLHRVPNLAIGFTEDGKSDYRAITIDYDVSQVNECFAVYDEIIKLFKPITKKTAPSAKKGIEETGKGIQIFPINGASYFMIDIVCEYHERAKRYELSITLFENNWWK